jgi:hypothetical protein
MDRPRPGLTYVPVKELDRSKMFDNFTVRDQAGEKLGQLEGFNRGRQRATVLCRRQMQAVGSARNIS